MNQTAPIDLVYTWVDGGDADYQALARRYAREKTDLNPERYRDEYSLLKYSLRSVARFLPWYRRIHIVTCRPQVPDWLNTAHPDIRIVHHDQIFDTKYLPTFNSNTIESFLHRIPGLSDCFLYVNDDHLFGRKTLKSDFITRQAGSGSRAPCWENIPVFGCTRTNLKSFPWGSLNTPRC